MKLGDGMKMASDWKRMTDSCGDSLVSLWRLQAESSGKI